MITAKRLVLLLLTGIVMASVACSSIPFAPAEPTPNIEATVEARLAEERASVNVSKDVNTPEPTPTEQSIVDELKESAEEVLEKISDVSEGKESLTIDLIADFDYFAQGTPSKLDKDSMERHFLNILWPGDPSLTPVNYPKLNESWVGSHVHGKLVTEFRVLVFHGTDIDEDTVENFINDLIRQDIRRNELRRDGGQRLIDATNGKFSEEAMLAYARNNFSAECFSAVEVYDEQLLEERQCMESVAQMTAKFLKEAAPVEAELIDRLLATPKYEFGTKENGKWIPEYYLSNWADENLPQTIVKDNLYIMCSSEKFGGYESGMVKFSEGCDALFQELADRDNLLTAQPLASKGDIHLLEFSAEEVNSSMMGMPYSHQLVAIVHNKGNTSEGVCVRYEVLEDEYTFGVYTSEVFVGTGDKKQKHTEPLFEGGTRVELKDFGFDKKQYGGLIGVDEYC